MTWKKRHMSFAWGTYRMVLLVSLVPVDVHQETYVSHATLLVPCQHHLQTST